VHSSHENEGYMYILTCRPT